jgi:hypothetical protein
VIDLLNEYVTVKNLVKTDICKNLSLRILEKYALGNGYHDSQCALSPAFDGLLDDLAEYVRIKLVDELKTPLWSTYNYCRIYKQGEILTPHKDKNQCEIAVSLTLDYDNKMPWPIYIYSNDQQEAIEFNLEIGDALIYKGYDLLHWRNTFQGPKDQIQAFLFYATDDRFEDPFFPEIKKLIKKDYQWLL